MSSRNSAKGAGDGSVKIEHKPKTVKQLIGLKDQIHLNPAWQRGPVWSPSKQALLIDSILRDYDIPMLYLRECPPSLPYKYEVVDGQQRLRALFNFASDDLSLTDDLEPVGNTLLAGKKFHDLPKSMRDKILSFRVVIAFVTSAGEPEISRLFSRMQMGVRLNPAELRNSVQTGLRHAIDGCARLHPFFANSRISSARFKHQDYLAHAISVCLHAGGRDLKAPQLMDDYVHVTDTSIYQPMIAAAHDILTILKDVNNLTSKRLTQKWMFVDLFYLLYQRRNKLSKASTKPIADLYTAFDNLRLEHNAEPEVLLKGKKETFNQHLYNYINAFKISGGERKNIEIRNHALSIYFKDVLGE